MKPYLCQQGGTHCFVVGVYNCLLYNDLPLFDIAEGERIAASANGPAIYEREFISGAKPRWLKRRIIVMCCKWGDCLSSCIPFVMVISSLFTQMANGL